MDSGIELLHGLDGVKSLHVDGLGVFDLLRQEVLQLFIKLCVWLQLSEGGFGGVVQED